MQVYCTVNVGRKVLGLNFNNSSDSRNLILLGFGKVN